MKNRKAKIEVGDLVQLSKVWDKRVGLVSGTDKDWWVIKDHFDVAGCIANRKDIKIITKGIVPKKLRRYLKR